MPNMMALRESFSGDGILICFNGPFTHSIIEEIGNAVKRYLEGETEGRGSIMDVFAVYIEQTQNVRNYIVRQKIQGKGRNSAIVVISRKLEASTSSRFARSSDVMFSMISNAASALAALCVWNGEIVTWYV